MGNGSPRVRKMKQVVSRHKAPMIEDMAARFYREVNPRREQEIMDARMIQEDHNAIANLSPRFINREFDANRYMQSLGRNDESSEIGE